MDITQKTTEEPIKEQKRIKYDKLTFFYMSLPHMLLGYILGALLIAALLFNNVDNYSLGIWLLLNILVFGYRLYHFYLFKNTSEKNKLEESDIWLDRYYTDVLVNGIIWGASAFLIFPTSDLLSQSILLLFLVTVGFSSMGVLASNRELLLTYVLVIFIPIIMRLFFLEGEIYRTIAYAGLALVLLMILAANYYGSIINNALTSYQNYLSTRNLYQQLREQFFSVLERAPVGIVHYDDQLVIEEANTNFLKLMGYKKPEDIVGKYIGDLWPNEKAIEHLQRVLRGFEGKSHNSLIIPATAKRKESFVNLSSSPMHNNDNKIIGGISIIADVTSEINAKNELQHIKNYDPLTKLPNRTLLLEFLKEAINNKLRERTYGAVLFLDIDHFNNINRSYGQKTGDKMLKKIADQFRETVKEKVKVARIGADVFVLLLPELEHDKIKSKELILECVSKLHKSFENVLVLGDIDYYVGFTVGATLFNSNNTSPLDLLKYAENALVEAKKSARGTIRFFERGHSRSDLFDITIANDIHKAIKNNELSIYYQPQQDIQSGTLTGAEALVRWSHPKKGEISPALFVPIAEESGAIIELEEWIFEQIFQDMRTMAESLAEFPLDYIAINVSSIHFLQPNFIEKFTKLANRYRINPMWVNIEITESGLMENIDEAIARIRELKKLGFGFSIDDFGTGYSSLTYLKKLPVDIIKIDRSFVKDADKNEGDRLIVESVIEISRKFGFKVLAEGIDRQETLDYFKTTSCKTFQGYLYYKPLSMEQFIQII